MSSFVLGEPVSPSCQIAIMPFLAGVEGLLNPGANVNKLRITMHRVMAVENCGYLQQISGYFPLTDTSWREKVGRVFEVTTGIIGRAYKDRKVMRTKRYETEAALFEDLAKSMKETGDTKSIDDVGTSYLAVPFLGANGEVALVMYAECREFNFFADDLRVQQVVAMCKGFCRLFDMLTKAPFPNLRNFPLEPGSPVRGKPTVYPYLHEEFPVLRPAFNSIVSFNYDAAVA